MITYNHANYIREALDSIFLQNVNLIKEVIICDDCSTDATISICQEYKAKYPELIRFVSNKSNVGVLRNFSKSISLCCGKYIAFLEGDDYWIDPNKLQKQLAFIEKKPNCSMVFTDRIIINDRGEKIGETIYEKDSYTTLDVINGFIPSTQTIFIRNYANISTFLNNHLDAYSGDRYLTYFCSLMGTILKISEFTASYRDSGYGVWSNNSPINRLKQYPVLLESFHSSLGLPLENEIAARANFNAFVTLLSYCLKRPKLFLRDKNMFYLKNVWKKYKNFNRLSYIITAFKNKF
jgi:glycosyltransferase involved in cell wall biosynthesis